ncbi:MAG: hypothetical protein MK364_07940, partial [Pirellulales bacterium]|nr:hypothetical protein [Pirellulales bacterium]
MRRVTTTVSAQAVLSGPRPGVLWCLRPAQRSRQSYTTVAPVAPSLVLEPVLEPAPGPALGSAAG